MKWSRALWVLGIVVALAANVLAGPIALVEKGKSSHSIYLDAKAPKSVARAAEELRRVVQKATGCNLPITSSPAAPMICLGLNDASRAAGVDIDLPEIGFRIVTKGNDIFILGTDTPDGQEKWGSQVRQGTMLGTFDFLEKAANVRWLMPGDVGEDVPTTSVLLVNEMNVQESPTIANRWLIAVRDKLEIVDAWKDHNKVDLKPRGSGVNWSHSFNSTPPNELVRQHPEWMPMRKDGSRAPTPAPGSGHVMYCLSNKELIEAFANTIIEAFDKNPQLYSMSMSPDEGAAFCDCPECGKFTTAPAEKWKDLGVTIPQRTGLVVRFWNQVAAKVREKHPDRVLGASPYQTYLLPLDQPVKMEPNIVFGVAINNGYGFKFYKPERQAVFQAFFDEWGKYGPPMGYYSHDTWMRNWFSIPLPPGRQLLKWNFPVFKRNRVQYLQYVGLESWGSGGLHNWLVAKLMWNADAEVDALQNEYLSRAYGAEAGALMGRMYDLAEASLQKFIIDAKKAPDHEIDYASAKAVYGPIFPEMEKLFLEAQAKPMTDAQKARFEMLADNMRLAHFHMRKANLIDAEEAKKSPLFVNTDDIEAFVTEKEKGIAIIPVSEWQKIYRYPDMPVLRVNWRPK